MTNAIMQPMSHWFLAPIIMLKWLHIYEKIICKKKELTIMVSSFVLVSDVGRIQQLVICEHLLVVQVLHGMHI